MVTSAEPHASAHFLLACCTQEENAAWANIMVNGKFYQSNVDVICGLPGVGGSGLRADAETTAQ